MMITAYRGDGLRPAPQPIVEPLLADDALLHRARAELDANAHALTEVSLSVLPRTGLGLGQLASTMDVASGTLQIGRITGIGIEANGTSLQTTVTLEVPTP